jgi:hypothetical protein
MIANAHLQIVKAAGMEYLHEEILEHFQNVMVPSISILQGNNALANNNSPITTTPTTICSIDHFGEELLECCKGLSIYKV